MSFEETMVLLVFGFAAFMWVTRTFLWDDKIPGIDDTMIAIFAASLLFLIPSLNKGAGYWTGRFRRTCRGDSPFIRRRLGARDRF